MVIIVVCIDILPIDIRVPHKDSLVGVRSHRIFGHPVGDAQIRSTVGQIIVVLVFMDIRSFHRLWPSDFQFGFGTDVKAFHILVEFVDVKNVVVVVRCRTLVAAAAAKREIALAIIVKIDCRVKAPTDIVAIG